MERPVDRDPVERDSVPFDDETWRRMVDLVNFLRLHESSPEVQDRIGLAIVRLRLFQLRERQAGLATAERRSPRNSDWRGR